ncbi:MAG TPA: succinate dehydrogenase [Kiloniellaceae bacterium]|nr:succinate dehydrogenase [Kiloniellaceae bacterium]
MTERRLFVLQRLTALILAPLVLVHLGLILYAVRDGLTAQEILGRTQGSLGWALFYGVFVLAAAIHAPLGLRTILREWTGDSARFATLLSVAFGALLAGLGLRAVVAVVA